MSSPVITRLWAIVHTDVVLRLRRTSTLFLMLALCLLAYSIIPEPASGRGLIVINGARSLYNTSAVSFATCVLFAVIGIGLFGFYMVSNTIRRDTDSRVGMVIAATPVRSWEYIGGKFLGNVAFLLLVTAAYCVAMIAMYAIRGEAPFELLVFLRTYAQFCFSPILFVAVVALVFESLPVLSGRIGDVAYFFLWSLALVLPAVQMDNIVQQGIFGTHLSDVPWAAYIDFLGMGTSMASLKAQMPPSLTSFSLGASPFKASLAPRIITEVGIPTAWLLAKIISSLVVLLGLLLAYGAFHRFDPTKLRASARNSGRNILAVINTTLKPITRINTGLWALLHHSFGRFSFVRTVLAEMLLIMTTKPITLIALIVLNILGLVLPLASVQSVVLPIASVVFVALCADVALRERRLGTSALAFSLPGMKSGFVWIKFTAVWLLGIMFVSGALVRLIATQYNSGISLLVSVTFLSAGAIGIGTAVGSPKAFMVSALLLFYLSLNSGATTPALDFAGWFGTATGEVQIGYGAAALGLLLVGYAVHWWRALR
ncbi:MAG: hypothetical protein ACOVSW_14145 [Candidatus Kapaibacteriota bacterium]